MNLASVSWLLLLACSHEAVPKYLIWSRHVISSSLIKKVAEATHVQMYRKPRES